jgi:hypothetical protein
MLSLQNGLFCMRELTKAECAGDAHSGGSRALVVTFGAADQPGPRGPGGCSASCCLPGCSSDIRSDNVGRMPVERGPSVVIPHGGAWISMRGGFLHITQRRPGIQGGGDECVSQRVRPDALDDPGPAGRPADDPRGAVPVQPTAVCGQEDWPVCALCQRVIDPGH